MAHKWTKASRAKLSRSQKANGGNGNVRRGGSAGLPDRLTAWEEIEISMMKRETFAIASIYVPVKRRATLDPKKAQEIAESILQVGLQSPVLVRQDGERFVLVEGLHRLEACKQLGEETIAGYVVQARRH
jgi:sulfiredoxin